MKKLIPVVLLASALSASLYAQDVPPPPRPDDTGPSMEVTAKYIQDKLNGRGKLTQKQRTLGDPPNVTTDIKTEVLSAIADASSCTLSFRQVEAEILDYVPELVSITDKSFRISFRDMNSFEVSEDEGSGVMSYRPQFWHLAIKMSPQGPAHLHSLFARNSRIDKEVEKARKQSKMAKAIADLTKEYVTRGYIPADYEIDVSGNDSRAPGVKDSEEEEVVVDFTDEDSANRMAKAMVRAVELCGPAPAVSKPVDNDPFR